jgi:PAS domain S-box-containing protein
MKGRMATQTYRPQPWLLPAGLVAAMAGMAATYAFAQGRLRSDPGLSGALVATCCLVAAFVVFRRRNYAIWKSAPYLALGILAIGITNLWFMMDDLRGVDYEPGVMDVMFILGATIFFIPLRMEFREHFEKEDRREIAADVALIGAALGTILYLWVRPQGAGPIVELSSGVFALIAAGAFSSYGALALWVPQLGHIGQFVMIGTFCVGVMVFANHWVNSSYVPASPGVDLPFALGSLGLAVVVQVLPGGEQVASVTRLLRYGRPLLTTFAVATATIGLGLVATTEARGEISSIQGGCLILVLGTALIARILINQLRSSRATRAVQEAYDDKDLALQETDRALDRLQRANETLQESEEHLRLVFEAAVDGIVELNPKDVIVRANGAFCHMVNLPQTTVEGQTWSSLATLIETDESFATLPATGQGTLLREGHAIYLEARVSEVPGSPTRRLLLVRDVTAARVADQTIRSLFKFLQDRDEDRTRILRRTNAAIESERNRIARDLHDGPVQGVSAASLSLEAVLLMLRAGELEEGVEILSKVRTELSQEADNLRRLMSGLRPPLLEERGLVPALRETLSKFGRDNDIRTEFSSNAITEVPQDLETLAYRIVQEALSNAAKHSQATRIAVTVETLGGQLRIEIVDNGVGFDTTRAREFLQMGRVGLASMRERVELANGTFMVHATPGKGTTVLATLPLTSVPAARAFAANEGGTTNAPSIRVFGP